MIRRIAPIFVIYLCTAATWIAPWHDGRQSDTGIRQEVAGGCRGTLGNEAKTGGSDRACSGRKQGKTAKIAKTGTVGGLQGRWTGSPCLSSGQQP